MFAYTRFLVDISQTRTEANVVCDHHTWIEGLEIQNNHGRSIQLGVGLHH